MRAIIAGVVNSAKSAVAMHKSTASTVAGRRRRGGGQLDDDRRSSNEFPTNFSAIVADNPPQPPASLTRPVGNVQLTHRAIIPARVRPAYVALVMLSITSAQIQLIVLLAKVRNE